MCPPIAALYITFFRIEWLLVSKTVSKINLKNLKTRSLDSEDFLIALQEWIYGIWRRKGVCERRASKGSI